MNTGGYVDEIYTAEQYRAEHQPICLGTAGFGDKSDLEKALRF